MTGEQILPYAWIGRGGGRGAAVVGPPSPVTATRAAEAAKKAGINTRNRLFLSVSCCISSLLVSLCVAGAACMK